MAKRYGLRKDEINLNGSESSYNHYDTGSQKEIYELVHSLQNTATEVDGCLYTTKCDIITVNDENDTDKRLSTVYNNVSYKESYIKVKSQYSMLVRVDQMPQNACSLELCNTGENTILFTLAFDGLVYTKLNCPDIYVVSGRSIKVEVLPKSTRMIRLVVVNGELCVAVSHVKLETFSLQEVNGLNTLGTKYNDFEFIENVAHDRNGCWYNGVKIGNKIWFTDSLRSYSGYSFTLNGTGWTTEKNIGNGYGCSKFDFSEQYNVRDCGYLYEFMGTGRFLYYNSSYASISSTRKYQYQLDANVSYNNEILTTVWHVPTSGEWQEMFMYIKLKFKTEQISNILCGKRYWNTSNVEGSPGYDLTQNDAFGFSVYPCGYAMSDGATNYQQGNMAYFWTPDVDTPYNTWSDALGGETVYYNSSYTSFYGKAIRFAFNEPNPVVVKQLINNRFMLRFVKNLS